MRRTGKEWRRSIAMASVVVILAVLTAGSLAEAAIEDSDADRVAGSEGPGISSRTKTDLAEGPSEDRDAGEPASTTRNPPHRPDISKRRSVLGYTIECESGIDDCLLRKDTTPSGKPSPEPRLIVRGTLDEVEDALVDALLAEHGEGRPNLPVWSMGGRQFWADVFVHSGWRIQHQVLSDHYRLLDPDDVRITWGSYDACRTRFESERYARDIPDPGPHWVVLIHGIFSSRELMEPLMEALVDSGFEAVGVNYPSTRGSIDEHARQLESLLDQAEGIERVSFVAHSMGGIVTQRLLERRGKWRDRVEVDRVVLLGTPNQGSIVAEVAADLLPFALLGGPSSRDLTPEGLSDLPAPDVPFLIIAGGRGDGRGYNPAIPGDDDGVVSVESTKLNGARDHIVLPLRHRQLLSDPVAVDKITRFLRGEDLEPKLED